MPEQAELLTATSQGFSKPTGSLVDAATGIIVSVRKKDDRSKRWKGVKVMVSVDAVSSGGKRKVLIQLSFGWLVCAAAKGALRSHNFGRQRTRPRLR